MLRLGPFLQSLGLHLMLLLIILLLSHFLPQGKSEPLFLDLTSYQLEEEKAQIKEIAPGINHKTGPRESLKEQSPSREVQSHETPLSETSFKATHSVEEWVHPVKEEQASSVASNDKLPNPAESLSRIQTQTPQLASASALAKDSHQGPPQSLSKGLSEEKGVAQAKGEGKETTQEVYLKKNLSVIAEIVRRNLGYPYLARRMGWQGNLIITFVLTPKGEIRDLSIEKSSGYEVLDKNTLEVLKKTAPLFPHPPVEVKIRLPVRYELN